MLCCETGGTEAQDVEDLATFVSQLDALGVPAAVHVRSVPEGLSRNAQFDLAPYLIDGALGATDRVVLIGAHRLADAKLTQLRRLAGDGRDCLAFGAFETRQAMIGAKAKLSYVFGRDPQVFDLAEGRSGEVEPHRGCPVFGVARRTAAADVPRLLLVAPALGDAGEAAALVALALSRQFATAVLTDGRSKHAWTTAHGTDIAFYHYGEILPASLAERADVCVSFAPLTNNYRLRCLVANLAVSGAVLIDGTRDRDIAGSSDAFVPGPVDLPGLAAFFGSQIVPNLGEIAAQVRRSRFAARCDPAPVLRFLDAAPRPRAPRAPAAAGRARVVFMPTNGVGLGHAQRCGLVAAELDRRRIDPVFAAFPGCTKLVKSYGFDAMPLVGRSALHAQTHENDLPNYLRVKALAADARALVFDGGYVFDSVYRTILENRLEGVWIRRGLWQAGQDNSIALDREKAFARVIVPSEALDELNDGYSRGEHLRVVGPIVQRIDLDGDGRSALRARLAERYEREFDRLVVTQLGAGVAADRGAQIQALCGMMERRADVLHLVVVWPTAALRSMWFGWRNSRVVKTHHAGVLAAAADLCVSAAGYNSFHEALYNRLPAIFVPQMGSFMDDQRARARAAAERGLAAVVEPNELMTLEREIGRFLDEGKVEAVRRAIAELDLPETGNAPAARLIEEMTHGRAALERDPVADRPARRR